MAQIVILPDVRLWWASVFKPEKDSTDKKTGEIIKGKFSAVAIFSPDSAAGKIATEAFAKAAQEEFGPNWQAILGAISPDKKCIRQGNLKLDEEGNVVEAFKDMLYISAKRRPEQGAPAVVDNFLLNGKPAPVTEDSGRIYRGCRVNLKVEISGWKSKEYGNQVMGKLIAVQFHADGEAFGSPPPSADGFEFTGDSPSLAGVDAATASLFG